MSQKQDMKYVRAGHVTAGLLYSLSRDHTGLGFSHSFCDSRDSFVLSHLITELGYYSLVLLSVDGGVCATVCLYLSYCLCSNAPLTKFTSSSSKPRHLFVHLPYHCRLHATKLYVYWLRHHTVTHTLPHPPTLHHTLSQCTLWPYHYQRHSVSS